MPRKSTSTVTREVAPQKKRGVLLGVGIALGLVFTIGVVVWGRSDSGQIDVSATLQNSRNNTVQDENAPPQAPVISNELARLPNGGLQPPGSDSIPAPVATPEPEPVATTTASTTPEGEEPTTEESGGEEEGVAEDIVVMDETETTE